MISEIELKQQLLEHEAQRFRELEGSGDELLTQALGGRPKNEQNVVNIWKLAYSAFSVWSKDATHPANRGVNRHDKFWLACSDYLKSAGWTLQQMTALRYPSPLPGQIGFESVLTEFETKEKS